MKHYFPQATGLAFIACLTLATPGLLIAQDEVPAAAQANGEGAATQAAPATTPVEGDAVLQEAPATEMAALKAVIVGVNGMVQIRTSSDQPWQKAAIGQEVPFGAEIRTGIRSQVRFDIISSDPNEPPHQVAIDRLGVVTLLSALEGDGKISTDLGMKYGRTSYKVEAGSLEHESRIRAPGSTLALRSTDGQMTHDPAFGTHVVVSDSPNSTLRSQARRLTVSITDGELTQDSSGPADHALGESVIDGTLASTVTGEDANFVNTLPGYGDVLVQGGLVNLIQETDTGGGSIPDHETPHFSPYDVLAGANFLDLLLFDPSPDGDTVRVLFTSPGTSPLDLGSFLLSDEANGSTINLTNLGVDLHSFTIENLNSGNDNTNTATIKILTGPQANELFDFTTFNTGDQASITVQGGSGGSGGSGGEVVTGGGLGG